ncbi:MAG TPA: ABC transporter ATP-binding protein, partial [Planctomycetes bacterium]|nr:ABC transporter ATP-binding protein [Planctomycetota bacterium]
VGDQIGEALRLHEGMSRSQARERSIDLLRLVGIPSPETRVSEYPHQLSGGMKQRVMIAMALACNPALLIADEPTTALDVTIQAQILELLRDLQREKGMAILLITHDLGVVAENADHVVVMYAGKVVERAPVDELFGSPKHPYTLGLFRSLPRLDNKRDRLEVIEGNVPNPLDFPSGCKFRPRCRHATEECARTEPQLQEIDDEHQVACHHWANLVEMESGNEGADQ